MAETRLDGTKAVRLTPAEAAVTPAAMREVFEAFNGAWGDAYYDALAASTRGGMRTSTI